MSKRIERLDWIRLGVLCGIFVYVIVLMVLQQVYYMPHAWHKAALIDHISVFSVFPIIIFLYWSLDGLIFDKEAEEDDNI